MQPEDAPPPMPLPRRLRCAVSGLVAAPGFPLWASVTLHAAAFLVFASVKSGAPAPEPEPPQEPISISFEAPPPSYSFAESPVLIDLLPELAEPEPPALEADEDPLEDLAEAEPPPAPDVSVEIPVPVEAFLLDDSHEEEPATEAASEASQDEPAGTRAEEEASLICPPEFLSGVNRPPRYPRHARRRGCEGAVILEIEVLADGSSGRVSVAESSGHEILDAAAVEAARKWRFVPARRGAREARSVTRIRVVFRLE